jgi:hypothetical protein
MEQEEVEIDILALIVRHGEQHLNNLLESQLKKLQKDLLKGKGKENNTNQNLPPLVD